MRWGIFSGSRGSLQFAFSVSPGLLGGFLWMSCERLGVVLERLTSPSWKGPVRVWSAVWLVSEVSASFLGPPWVSTGLPG